MPDVLERMTEGLRGGKVFSTVLFALCSLKDGRVNNDTVAERVRGHLFIDAAPIPRLFRKLCMNLYRCWSEIVACLCLADGLWGDVCFFNFFFILCQCVFASSFPWERPLAVRSR